MESNLFFNLLKEYLIEDLVDLEDRVEGQGVLIDEGNGWFVELEKDNVMLQDVSGEDIETFYSKYNYVFPGLPGEGFFQSLNYEDFLSYKNHFRGVVGYFMDIMEQRIFDSFQNILNSKLDNAAGLDIFSSRVFDEFEKKLKTLKSHFTNEGDYKIHHYYDSSINTKISEIMEYCLERQEQFYYQLQQELKNLYSKLNKELVRNNSTQGFFKTADGFEKFLKFQDSFSDESSDKKFTLYSFVFQKMLERKIIEKITHLEFFSWLKDQEFINWDLMEKFLLNGSMKSLNKSSTKGRIREFNRIFEIS